MKRKALIAGNWKMYNTVGEALDLLTALKKGVNPDTRAEVMVAPSYTALAVAAEVLKDSGIILAAQDTHWEDKGAFTSAVSPVQIKDAGCSYVIIGHSERRSVFGDTDEIINKKIAAALKHCLTPVLCVGETLAERESNKTYRVLETQLADGLKGFTAEDLAKLVIAYEPVWAIGTGKTATPEQAQDAHLFIRKQLAGSYSQSFADAVRILYGGSVKPDNVDSIMAQPDVDGALVGGASLKAADFLRIINFQELPVKA
ncbi:MAG: triose-phosphate isomerase [Elusimicrobiaceae bacterium]